MLEYRQGESDNMLLHNYHYVYIAVYMAALISYLFVETSGNFKARAVNKIILALMYLVFSFVFYIRKDKGSGLNVLMLAICLSCVGDILLLWDFKDGGAAFMVGNSFYAIYLLENYYYQKISITAFVFVCAALYGLYYHLVKTEYFKLGDMTIFNLYMASIILHGSLGLVLMYKTSVYAYKILGAGLTLFMISDYFMADHKFHNRESKWILRLNSLTYFVGMMMVSIFMSL